MIISFTGCDGAGKTTHIDLLKKRICNSCSGVLPVNRTIKNNKFLYRQPNYGWRYFYATFIY